MEQKKKNKIVPCQKKGRHSCCFFYADLKNADLVEALSNCPKARFTPFPFHGLIEKPNIL